MKTVNRPYWSTITLIFCLLLFSACAEKEKKDYDDKTTSSEMTEELPRIEAASDEYADLVQKSMDALANFEFDKAGELYADDIEWYWPDGDTQTRGVIKSKDSVVAWWKNWKATSGLEQMSFSNINMLPLKSNKANNYYNIKGVAVLQYADSKMVYNGKETNVRMHWVWAFNEDKKVNRALGYYDRTGLVKLMEAN